MSVTNDTMVDQVEEGLALLWFEMEEAGHAGFQEEIEEVGRLFPVPEGSPFGRRVIERAHDLFERVRAEFAPMGRRPVPCPHCGDAAAA